MVDYDENEMVEVSEEEVVKAMNGETIDDSGKQEAATDEDGSDSDDPSKKEGGDKSQEGSDGIDDKEKNEDNPVDEGKSNDNDSQKEEGKQKEPEEQGKQQDDFSLKLKEAFGEEIDNIDKLKEHVAGLNSKLEKRLTASGIMEEFDKSSKEMYGIGYSDLYAIKNEDLSSLSGNELLERKMLADDPDISYKEMQAELRQYDLLNKPKEEIEEMIEEGKLTQNEFNFLQSKYSREVRNARNELKGYQDEINFDEIKIGLQNEENQNQQPQLDRDELYKTAIDALKDFDNDKIKVGDAEINFAVDKEAVDKISNAYAKFDEFVQTRWLTEDGKPNLQKFASDMNSIINREQRDKVIYDQGISDGIKRNVEKDDNIDFSKDQGAPKNDDPKDVHDQMVENGF